MPADQPPTSRLGVVDEIFLRTHRGMGTPIALQGLWRFPDRVAPQALEPVHAALRTGPLGRRVVRARIPGARPYWRANTSAHPLRISERVLRADELLDWADAQGSDLDPEYAPGWRLAAAALEDGGSVVALTCSHVLADGRGLTIAVDQALSGVAATEVVTPQSDWADAWRQWSIVLGGAARAFRRGVPRRPTAAASRSGVARTCGVVLEIPVPDWETAAAAHAATGNSLFVHLVARILWDSGFAEPRIAASIPVDTRGEPRVDNDMAMTEVTVIRSDTPASLREKCRAAYEHRMSGPQGMPEEILQVLPARAAHAVSRGAGERDILCSNIGPLPTALSHLGPHPCRGVAARAIHPGLTPPLPRTRLSAYLSRLAGTYTLALTSLDPDHIETPTALRDLVRTTLAEHGLTPAFW